jgi:hypothetical protein
MPGMGGDSAVSMFAGLVDHSVQRIRRIAADPRRFDRQEIARIADVWDNNTGHFFGVLQTRLWWRRERQAREALRWMADFGSDRREWMIRYGGEPMRRLLGPAPPDPPFHRDHQGTVRCGPLPLEQAGMDVDYDLAGARVTSVRLECSGAGFGGQVLLRVPRRFADGDCVVQLYLSDVRQAQVDSAGTAGIAISAHPAGVELRIGAGASVLAGSVEVWPDDPLWHLSQTGRAADAVTGPGVRRLRHPAVTRPTGAAGAATIAFQQAMVQIRRVRWDRSAARVPILQRCAVLAEAGSRAVAARPRALALLAEQWAREVPDLPGPAGRIPPGAVLTLAGSSATAAWVVFAEPVADGWRLGAAELARPGRIVLDGGRLSLQD